MVGLHAPAFPDDDGSADPALRSALTGDLRDAMPTIRSARLLVPVVAVASEVQVGDDGLTRDTTAEMATVTMTGKDGRVGLLAFTGLDSLTAWRVDARPVAVRAVDVARAAQADGAEAVVIDVAGPVTTVIDGPALRALAEGRAWLAPVDDPEVLDAIRSALHAVGIDAQIRPGGDEHDLLVVLQDATVDDARRCADVLAGIPLLRSRLDRGLAVAIEARNTP